MDVKVSAPGIEKLRANIKNQKKKEATTAKNKSSLNIMEEEE